PTEIVLADDKLMTFTYDGTFSQMTGTRDPNGNTTSFGVDPTNGNVTSTTLPPVLICNGDACTSTAAICTTTYEPRRPSLPKSRCDGNGNFTTFSYDAPNERLKSIQFPPYPGPLSPVATLTYNSASYLNTVQDEDSYTGTFTFDNLGRAISATLPTSS